MKSNKQKWFWILDLALFTGFLVAFYLDLTGLSLHQWLGVVVGVFAALHLVLHWNWVKSLASRLFEKNVGRCGTYFIVDSILFAGLFLIVLTGLVISSWLNLPLVDYLFWRNLHVTVSIVTLLITLVKLGLHWRWIVKTAQKIFNPQPRVVLPAPAVQPAYALQPVQSSDSIDRRHFLGMMGIVGLGSLVAVSNVLIKPSATLTAEETQALALASGQQPTQTPFQSVESAAAASQPISEPTQAEPTAVPTSEPTVQSVAAVSPCTVRCPNGCSYPGNCRRYTDSNANGLCDLGECM